MFGVQQLPTIRLDIAPRIGADTIHHIRDNQRQASASGEYLQNQAVKALKFARAELVDDRNNGHRHENRINGEGNIPAYWHIAYSAGFPISELASTIDEYLEQLEHFDKEFSTIWQPARRIIEVQFKLEEALKGLAWLVGMRATPAQLARYLDCCGPPGQDALFDRIVCQLGFARPMARRLRMPMDHQHLMALIDGAVADRPKLAVRALEKWARALARSGAPSKPGDLGYVGQWDLPLALVVMLWDIDDVGLSDHPHYPRDLVAHFRAYGGHVLPITSGEHLPEPAPGKRINLDQRHGTDLERWLALASDGDEVAVAAALSSLDETGALESSADLAFGALAEHGQAICADLKDDETLEAQLHALIAARAPGSVFESDDIDGNGAARCEAVMVRAQAWIQRSAGNLRLLQYSSGQDDWRALLVQRKHVDELEALSQQLRLAGRFT
ncbi:PoNe immunity protein domain-containing protein [Pelomonas aquatica]|jgi:hypothetical protein|nr:PoNe immunity protein domain-containing protein [Pelomonas aquatica]MCY4756499.1 DUF1911 domain-containing protein [Pelomonas aquatica]